MRLLRLAFCLSVVAGSAPFMQAGGCTLSQGCCGAEKACDFCEQPCGVCRPVAKCEPVKKTCYEIECKTICIPAVTLPWQNGPLAGLLGGGKCGAASCGSCGASCTAPGPCGACGTNGNCKDGFCSDICGEVRAVRTLKKSSKTIGEKLVCEWKHDPNGGCGPNGHCGACKPGCCNDGIAPPASAPVEVAPEPPASVPPAGVPAAAPPETARQRVPGYSMRSSLRNVLTVSLD